MHPLLFLMLCAFLGVALSHGGAGIGAIVKVVLAMSLALVLTCAFVCGTGIVLIGGVIFFFLALRRMARGR
jgi:hypothetical protein